MLVSEDTALLLLSKNKELTSAGTSYMEWLSVTLDDEFQKGEITSGTVDISAPAGTLNLLPVAVQTMAKEIGDKCAVYWSKTLTPAGGMVSVTNDAMKIASPIETKLLALNNGKYRTPSYNDFVKVIYDEVKTIEWVVTEPAGSTHTTNVV